MFRLPGLTGRLSTVPVPRPSRAWMRFPARVVFPVPSGPAMMSDCPSAQRMSSSSPHTAAGTAGTSRMQPPGRSRAASVPGSPSAGLACAA